MKSKRLVRNGIITIAIILSTITFFLSFWQYKRLQWKEDMISSYEAAQQMPAKSFSHLDERNIKQLKEQKIIIEGKLPSGDIAKYAKYIGPRTIDDKTGPGYYAFIPLILNDGTIVPMNIGWVQGIVEKDWSRYGYDEKSLNNYQGAKYRLEAVPTGISMSKSRYTPINKADSKIWLYFDSEQFMDIYQKNSLKTMGTSKQKIIKSMYLHVNKILKGPKIKGIVNNPYKRKFVNKHKEYMITWLILAIMLLVFAGFALFGRVKGKSK